MGLLSWIILGGLAGWLASKVTGKDESMGIIANVIVGVVGAFLGGWLWQMLGGETDASLAEFDLASFLVAFGGAVLLLWVVKMFKRT
jgi:uncharacterized membrane protein YeaQ/YmgE (transglycosylase-associated protein family)